MKKQYRRYVKYGIVILVLIGALSGCGKEDSKQENEQEETKEEEVIVVTQEPETVEEEEQPQETGPVELQELEGQLQNLLLQVNGTSAVYVEDLSIEAYASISSQPMQSASLIKLFVAGCVYEHLDQVKAQEAYDGETEELMRIMITVSDNDAANTLTTRLGNGDAAAGRAAVNQFCQEHGYGDTYMGRMMLDFSSTEDNYTSVRDCGSFLKGIYRQELVGADAILGYMKQQERTGKIPAGVPEGVATANKTGELTDVENDAAIIFTDTGAYTICVMMSGLPDAAAARSVITQLSSVVYQYMISQ